MAQFNNRFKRNLNKSMNEGWKIDYYDHMEKLTLLRIKGLDLTYLSYDFPGEGETELRSLIDLRF